VLRGLRLPGGDRRSHGHLLPRADRRERHRRHLRGDGRAWSTFQGTLPITGAGTLTVCSEFAVTQQLDLDLAVGNDPPAPFEGLVVTPGQIFPDVEVTVSRFGMVCLDTALTIAASPVTADLDGDGRADVADLLLLLGAWGDCPGPPDVCAADLDRDGAVGVADLLIVLSRWSRAAPTGTNPTRRARPGDR
jgi:hypothetical protein